LSEAILDSVFPVLYGSVLALLLMRANQRALTSPTSFVWLPVLIVVFDWTENVLIIAMLLTFSNGVAAIAPVSSVVTIVKWWLGLPYALILFYRYVTPLFP